LVVQSVACQKLGQLDQVLGRAFIDRQIHTLAVWSLAVTTRLPSGLKAA
jgi:hypothetical protein